MPKEVVSSFVLHERVKALEFYVQAGDLLNNAQGQGGKHLTMLFPPLFARVSGDTQLLCGDTLWSSTAWYWGCIKRVSARSTQPE